MSKRVVNQYAAKCAYCRKRVDPYGGLCWKDEKRNAWVTAHETCIPNLDKNLPKVQSHAAAPAPAMPLRAPASAPKPEAVPSPLPEPSGAPGPFNKTFPPLDDDPPF